MRTHNFSHGLNQKAMYHTMTDVVKANENIKSCTMTGLVVGGIEEGDLVEIYPQVYLKCVEVLCKRDHPGFFKKDEDRKNAYFKARFEYYDHEI